MTLRDISLLVSAGTPEWPGDTPYSCGWTWRIAQGQPVNVSSITLSPHVGTHADAPLHVHDDWPGSDTLPLSVFAGHCVVVSVPSTPADVGLEELRGRIPHGTQRLLLRTGQSIAGGKFPDDWPAVTPECARTLVQEGLLLLGVDAPSVDRRTSTKLQVHHELFGAGAYNLENLDLSGIGDGEYELLAFPLRLAGLDAAPARAVLRERVAHGVEPSKVGARDAHPGPGTLAAAPGLDSP